MTRLYDYILAQDDQFGFVYDGISGRHGEETQHALTELYSDVVIDYGLHPDDDFEQIIERMLDLMEGV
jgi:hypothetical protein